METEEEGEEDENRNIFEILGDKISEQNEWIVMWYQINGREKSYFCSFAKISVAKFLKIRHSQKIVSQKVSYFCLYSQKLVSQKIMSQ